MRLTGGVATDDGGMRSPATEPTGLPSWLAPAVAAVGSAVALAFFMFVDIGGTLSGIVHPASLFAAAVWAGPLWLYAGLVRTRAGALSGGVVLLAAITWFLVALFRSTGSTAGIGVFTIPMVLYPLAVAVLAVDRLLFAQHSGEERLLSTLVRRLIAVVLSFVVVGAVIQTILGILSLFGPVTRGHPAVSLVRPTISAAVAIVGGIAIRRLWCAPADGAGGRAA